MNISLQHWLIYCLDLYCLTLVAARFIFIFIAISSWIAIWLIDVLSGSALIVFVSDQISAWIENEHVNIEENHRLNDVWSGCVLKMRMIDTADWLTLVLIALSIDRMHSPGTRTGIRTRSRGSARSASRLRTARTCATSSSSPAPRSPAPHPAAGLGLGLAASLAGLIDFWGIADKQPHTCQGIFCLRKLLQKLYTTHFAEPFHTIGFARTQLHDLDETQLLDDLY